MIVIAGKATVQAEMKDKAVELIKVVAAATRAEEGCISYGFSVDLDDPNTFCIFEEWESIQALGAHAKSAHMAAFMPEFGKALTAKPVLKKYEVDSVSDL